MPVLKYRRIEDMPTQKWRTPGDPAIVRALRGIVRMGTRLATPLRMPKGVHKYRSVEEANADRERWEQERIDRLRAARAKK